MWGEDCGFGRKNKKSDGQIQYLYKEIINLQVKYKEQIKRQEKWKRLYLILQSCLGKLLKLKNN